MLPLNSVVTAEFLVQFPDIPGVLPDYAVCDVILLRVGLILLTEIEDGITSCISSLTIPCLKKASSEA